MLGYTGAHRTGKTTLAEAFAQRHDMTLLKTSASAVFRAAGFDPSAQLALPDRIAIQEVMLQTFEKHYAQAASKSPIGLFVADRTPADLAAYLLADIGQRSTEELTPQTLDFAVDYVRRCLESCSRWFSVVILVQPGIPVVEADGKARGCPLFMEHLNSLMLGLLSDERMKAKHFYLPRKITDLEQRVAASERALGRVVQNFQAERESLVFH